jgi:GDPmannose 4,6-dehydratase
MKKAIITGINGQDGAFLADLLLSKGYEVIGADRRRVDVEYWRLRELGILDRVKIVDFDLLEDSVIYNLIRREKPDEFYNLGAQSFVKASFDMPILTAQVDALAVMKILEAIRIFSPKTKFYQASTSEMFGKVTEIPQSESTPFYPRSPYGVSKLFAHWAVINYRESYNLHLCSGILFNHESEFRGEQFVTQKIVRGAVAIKKGLKNPIILGNLDAERDWGFAGDYVLGMYLMLHAEVPSDYVLASGVKTSVRKFVELTFNYLGIEIIWNGEGIDEEGLNQSTGDVLVKISEDFYRPAEVDLLLGDYSKAKNELGWTPKVDINGLVKRMIDFEMRKA